MLALIPGTSRSGITITGARFLNYDRSSAIKISMLMSIPTIIAAATLEFYSLGFESLSINWIEMVLAVIISALAAFGALTLMVQLLKTINFTPYVLYRILLGGILIIWAFV
jgi:undecaprenyl-diphosphatase